MQSRWKFSAPGLSRQSLARALLALALISPNALSMAAPANPKGDDARLLLDALQAGDYTGAEVHFSAQMAQALPPDRLKAVWESLQHQLGPLQSRGDATITQEGAMTLIVVPLQFERGKMTAHIRVDADSHIAGLLLQPVAAPLPPAAPVARDAGFQERSIEVPGEPGPLPGTLAMPTGAGPFPAVVLVHGSGPNDRDESVGGNRPFLDLARGLAARGIAVLRYDKRTLARPQDFASGAYTMDDETTNDAVAAIATLRATAGIDPARVFVLGHSQGAMLAPRIATRAGVLAGVVMWAAPARPLLTLLPEQNRYLLGLDGDLSTQDQAFLDDLQRKIAHIRSGAAVATKDSPLGVPASYWRAFEQVDARRDALALRVPLLLLQGGRDFQVTDTDWRLWQTTLKDDPRATLEAYPALNHLGIAGSGPGLPGEYAQPGRVDAQLIGDVADWLLAQPGIAQGTTKP